MTTIGNNSYVGNFSIKGVNSIGFGDNRFVGSFVNSTSNVTSQNLITTNLTVLNPTGTFSPLTLENLTFSSTVTTPLSTEINVSNITTYDYNNLNAGSLANPLTENSTKYILLANDRVAPVQVSTSRGSFILSNQSVDKANLIFNNNVWRELTTNNLTWFPTTQQGSKLVGTGAGTGTVTSSIQGFSVSADGNTVAVGGFGDNGNKGATWIFTRTAGVWTQQGPKLVGTGAVGTAQQGYSVSLSADGNTLAVGGSGDDGFIGATWIFTRSAGVWTQQGPKLVGTGAVGNAGQGSSVSLASNGDTLAVGGPDDNGFTGATWIFTRSAGTWTQQGLKLVGTGAVSNSVQGFSLALSADANTLAVGGFNDNSGLGATWIFIRTGVNWTQQGSKLVGTGNVGVSQQGSGVSLSADGDTLAVGGFNDNSGLGATWIFIRTGVNWTQQGLKLVGTGAVTPAVSQGRSVSLSDDGNTLAVGGSSDNFNQGATWIFTRTAGVWTQQGSKLIGSGAIGNAQQGYSVSLSSDGNTLAFGGPNDDTFIGATWIFTRTSGVWIQEGAKLVGVGAAGSSQQGSSVSVSADGNTLAVGAFADNGNVGATWIFIRSASVWSQQGAKLIGTGAVGLSNQGTSVSVSADGNTFAVAGYSDDNGVGATWIFVRSGLTWSQQGAKLIGSGAIDPAYQGYSVSLSADGNTLAVGGANDDSYIGATWIFTRTGVTWTQQGAKLIGTDAIDAAGQGYSVSLSSDGDTLAVGGPNDDTSVGATWVFVRDNLGNWIQQGSKLIGTDAVGSSSQGSSVSLSADGNTLAVGGVTDDSNVGATWIFTRFSGVWTQQGSRLIGSGAAGASQQGTSVSLASNGNTLSVGGPNDDSGVGATWIFTRIGSKWSQRGSKLIGSGAVGFSNQGYSVSSSADGNTLAVGGYDDDVGVGATWIFT